MLFTAERLKHRIKVMGVGRIFSRGGPIVDFSRGRQNSD